MNFIIAISIIYLIYFSSIYYKVLLIIPIVYLFGQLIIKYKNEIIKLRYCYYDYDSDLYSSIDLESGNSSDSYYDYDSDN